MPSNDKLFVCTQCGDCCKGFGGTYLTQADIRSIAEYVGISTEAFQEHYCVPSGRGLVLSQGQDGYCIFYSHTCNCTIHSVKPRMCREWPFIKSLSADISNWHAMASCCPGMRTDMEENQLKEYLKTILGVSGPNHQQDPE
jgi:Fe-S-cluster containining protein